MANAMIVNRSVPADTVLPHISYQNVADAIAWLTRTFGFTEHYRYGHPWLFSRHARDMGPEEWGATVSEITSPLALLPRPRLCYLEIPAVDIRQSVAFYENVFGWNIRGRDSTRPSFDDATGYVSGAW